MNVKEVKERILELLHSPVRMPILSDTMMGKQRLIIHIALLLILTFVLSLLSSHLILSYHEKAEKEQQIATMQSFLKTWQAKTAELNDSSMRPVDPKQLDQVQTDIIFSIQAYNLNLVSMKDEQKNKEQNGRVYTAEFSGTYENTMRCLQNFHAKDALIGIKSLKMSEKNGALNTKLTYKIYTK